MRAPKPGNPYVGLRAFDRADSHLFFGRIQQTTELLESLYHHRFLGVVGSSGCGKSSLVQAGLIPALLGGFLVEGRERWRIAPLRPGDRPLDNLALALGEIVPPEEGRAEALRRRIEEQGTPAVLDALADGADGGDNVLVLVDQFEEIFDFRGRKSDGQAELAPDDWRARNRRRSEAAEFVELLLDLARQDRLPVYVVLTVRADFLGDCDVFYGLPEALNSWPYLVPRLQRRQLREAIEGPARLFGARIDPRLTDHLLNDLGDRSDRLPILEHALMRTWEFWARDGAGPVGLAHYERTGGLGSALAAHADAAVAGLDRNTVARLFKSLTAVDSQGRWIRRPRRLSELADEIRVPSEQIRAIVDQLAGEGRDFLVESNQASGDPRVDLAHESLIRNWPLLSGWVEDERRSRDRYLALVRRAADWRRGEAALLHGADLVGADRWWREAAPTPWWAARYSADDDHPLAASYLAASRRRRAALVGLTTAAAVLVLVAAIWALVEWYRAEELAVKAPNQARLVVASSWTDEDPTTAGLVLARMERPEEVPGVLETTFVVTRRRCGAPLSVPTGAGSSPTRRTAPSPCGASTLRSCSRSSALGPFSASTPTFRSGAWESRRTRPAAIRRSARVGAVTAPL